MLDMTIMYSWLLKSKFTGSLELSYPLSNDGFWFRSHNYPQDTCWVCVLSLSLLYSTLQCDAVHRASYMVGPYRCCIPGKTWGKTHGYNKHNILGQCSRSVSTNILVHSYHSCLCIYKIYRIEITFKTYVIQKPKHNGGLLQQQMSILPLSIRADKLL